MTGIGKPEKTNKHNEDKCKGCIYRSKFSGWCNYGDITGRSRLKDGGKLNPNGGCNLYRKGEVGNRWRLPPKQEKPEGKEKAEFWSRMDEKYRQIEANYKAGLNDTEIARAVKCGINTVARWRKRHGYESNYSRKKSGGDGEEGKKNPGQ